MRAIIPVAQIGLGLNRLKGLTVAVFPPNRIVRRNTRTNAARLTLSIPPYVFRNEISN